MVLEYFFLLSLICGVTILLVTGITQVFRNRIGRKWRYVFWIILAVRMLLPFDISLPTPVVTVKVPQAAPEVVPEPVLPGISETEDPMASQTPAAPSQTRPETGSLSEADVQTGIQEPAFRIDWDRIWRAIPWIWLGGVGISAIWFLGGYLYQRRYLLRWSYAPLGQEVRRYFDLYRDELGVSHKVQIRVCKRITSPMMLGLVDPILVIPEGSYTAKDLEYIFRHELSHLKRHDVWVKSLMLLVRIIHWFNPAVILMYREMSDDIEILCDAQVVKEMGASQRKEYSEVILRYMVRKQEEKMEFSTCFGSPIERIKERFVQVVRGNRLRKAYGLCAVLLIILLVVSLLLTIDNGKDSEEESSPPDHQAGEESREESFPPGEAQTADGRLAEAYLSVVEEIWPQGTEGTLRLLDFDGDGSPELLIAYAQEGTALLGVYRYGSQEVQTLWEQQAPLAGTEDDPKVWLVHQEGRYMLRWSQDSPGIRGEIYEYHNGRMESVWQYDETMAEEGRGQINGGDLSLQDYYAQMNSLLSGALEQVIDFEEPEENMRELTQATLRALREGAEEGTLRIPSDDACWSSVQPYVYDESEAQRRFARELAEGYLSVIEELEQTYAEQGIYRLLDFDGDGTAELYCTFANVSWGRDYQKVDSERIYWYNGEEFELVWDEPMSGYWGSMSQTTMLLSKNNRVYLRWDETYVGDRGTYYTLIDGRMEPAAQYDYGRRSLSEPHYNGEAVSTNGLRAELNDWEANGLVQNIEDGEQMYEEQYAQEREDLKAALREAADTGELRVSDWDGAWAEPRIREVIEIPVQPVEGDPMRTAYREVIAELQMAYGLPRVAASMYQGLCMVKLVDFDGDGTEELYCAYSPVDDVNGTAFDYRERIYQYQGTQAVLIYEGRAMNLGTSVQPCVDFLYKDGRVYMRSGGEWDYAYLTLIDGQMQEALSYHFTYGTDENPIINGETVTREEYERRMSEFLEGGERQSYTFYSTLNEDYDDLVSVEEV